MKIEILFCKSCHLYTMEKKCPKCNGVAVTSKPAKYSPEDKYGHYRRLYKKEKQLTV